MSNQQNEALVRRMLESLYQPQLPDGYDQIMDPNWVGHGTIPFPRGAQGFKAIYDFWHGPFSDLSVTMQKMISDGDHVAAHYEIRGRHARDFMGAPPTGKPFHITVTAIFRCQNGRVAEMWVNPDRLGLLDQLGVIQAPGQFRQRAA